MSDLPERLRVVADERDEHACWREKLADDLHDRETQISDAWQALRDAGVQSEQSIADGIELMRRQLAEAQKEIHNLNWALGTEGYDQMATPEGVGRVQRAAAGARLMLKRILYVVALLAVFAFSTWFWLKIIAAAMRCG